MVDQYAWSVTPSGSFGEVHSGEFCDTLNVSQIKHRPKGELCGLQVRSVSSEDGHLLLRHGLHDVVNVDPLATGVRPKTVIDLIRFDELASDVRRTPEKRSKLGGFLLRKVSYRGHMPFWLDDEGPQPQRSDAVFDQPKSSPGDSSSR